MKEKRTHMKKVRVFVYVEKEIVVEMEVDDNATDAAIRYLAIEKATANEGEFDEITVTDIDVIGKQAS